MFRPGARPRHLGGHNPPPRRRHVVESVALLAPGLKKVAAKAEALILAEVRGESAARRVALEKLGASPAIVDELVRLFELDGVFGIAAMGARKGLDELAVTRAYTKLGEVLGIDWAQQQVARFVPSDHWERLLAAGLMRDFEQLRIDFLNRTRADDPDKSSIAGSATIPSALPSSAS